MERRGRGGWCGRRGCYFEGTIGEGTSNKARRASPSHACSHAQTIKQTQLTNLNLHSLRTCVLFPRSSPPRHCPPQRALDCTYAGGKQTIQMCTHRENSGRATCAPTFIVVCHPIARTRAQRRCTPHCPDPVQASSTHLEHACKATTGRESERTERAVASESVKRMKRLTDVPQRRSGPRERSPSFTVISKGCWKRCCRPACRSLRVTSPMESEPSITS